MAVLKFKLLSLVLLFYFTYHYECGEVHCSKFPYEEALLEKTVRMEFRLEQMERGFREMERDIIEQRNKLQREIAEYEKERSGGKPKAECQNGWTKYDNSCYLFSRLQFNFANAEQFCNQHGGHLVRIETERENEFLRNHCLGLQVARRWIGINDQIQEGRWVWQGTDTEIGFKNWFSREPNGAEKANCGALWEARQYHWADEPCDALYRPICEIAA